MEYIRGFSGLVVVFCGIGAGLLIVGVFRVFFGVCGAEWCVKSGVLCVEGWFVKSPFNEHERRVFLCERGIG